ncbi:MAG: flagellar motor switch protein FliN [Candidatus Margulisiibacteriota bacterium]
MDISIDQDEINSLLGFAAAPSSPSMPPPPAAPPSVDQRPVKPVLNAEPAAYQSLSSSKSDSARSEISLIKDVPLELSVELGRARRSIADILDFGVGTVVELNRLAGEPVDLMANGKLIAKGEVVVIDENFAIRIIEIINPKKESS